MKVIVQEDKAFRMWRCTSSIVSARATEWPGATGLSHFFEHRCSAGQEIWPRQVENTSNDVTALPDWFPSAALDLMFDTGSDRIRDLAFDPKIIESERVTARKTKQPGWALGEEKAN
jgi:zinc protease